MTILWMTCERKAETSSSVEHLVMEDSQILTLEKLWMGYGYGPQFDLRAYAFPTQGPTRSLRESPNRTWISENLALYGTVIFWKSVCFFNLPFFQLYESYNPVCMQNHSNPPRKKQSKNKSPRSETNYLEHLNKRLRETAYAASPTLSCAICLRRTYAKAEQPMHEWC